MLDVSVLLTEDDLARDFVAALQRHELPEKFFYWFPTSVRAWIDLCTDGVYRNFVRSRTLIDDHAADIAALIPKGDVVVVSLGAGQGMKDLLVLDAIRSSGRTPSYVPVDASQSLLEMACAAATAAGFARPPPPTRTVCTAWASTSSPRATSRCRWRAKPSAGRPASA